MSQNVLDRVRQIAADAFNEPLDKITSASSPDTIEGWDSLTHVNFVMAIEQSFECEIEPDEVEQLRVSVGDAVAVLSTKRAR